MAANLRPYTPGLRFTPDFLRVHEFLVRVNQSVDVSPGFPWGRWQWMFSLPYLNDTVLDHIGVWEDSSEIVALATYETELGNAWFCIDPAHRALFSDLLDHAQQRLCDADGRVHVLIEDGDDEFHRLARAAALRPTEGTEALSRLDAPANLTWSLPEGFRLTDLATECDLTRLDRCLWRGFNHPGEPSGDAQSLEERRISLSGPHLDLHHCKVVIAPNGDYASYCGMWHLPGERDALVEPVCTDSTYRMLGLGRAAVLAGVASTFAAGASRAWVGSSQQFYYSIGFNPIRTDRWWENGRVEG